MNIRLTDAQVDARIAKYKADYDTGKINRDEWLTLMRALSEVLREDQRGGDRR